jgi:hypothetical protein
VASNPPFFSTSCIKEKIRLFKDYYLIQHKILQEFTLNDKTKIKKFPTEKYKIKKFRKSRHKNL